MAETLAFVAAKAPSTLEDESDSERLEVWLVLIALFVVAKAPSTLDDCCERLLEVALMAARSASTLDEEVDMLRLEA